MREVYNSLHPIKLDILINNCMDALLDRYNTTHKQWLHSAHSMLKTIVPKNFVGETMKWLDQ